MNHTFLSDDSDWTLLFERLPLPALILSFEQCLQKLTVRMSNSAFKKELGYCAEASASWEKLLKQAFPEQHYRQWAQKVLQSELFDIHQTRITSNQVLSLRLICSDGAEQWFQFSASSLDCKWPNAFLCMLTPIKAADEVVQSLVEKNAQLVKQQGELQYSETQLRQAQEIANIGSWELDLQSEQIQWSDQLYKIYREDPDTFQPNLESFWEKTPDEEKLKLQNLFQQMLVDGQQKRVMTKHIRSDGSIAVIDIVGKPLLDELGKPHKVVGATMDVTHLIELQKQNEELAHIVQVARQEIYVVDNQSNQILYANSKAQEQLGLTESALCSMCISQINLDLTPKTLQSLKSEIRDKHKTVLISTHQKADGSTYRVKAIFQFIQYQGRQALVIFSSDLTAVEKAQKAQLQHYRLLKNVLDHVPVRIFWKDKDGRYQGGNQLLLEDAGLSCVEELIGKTDFDLSWGREDATKYREIDLEVMKTGQPNLQFEDYVRSKDGLQSILSLSTVPLYDEQGEVIGVLGSYDDITEWRDMEHKILQQQESLFHQANHDSLTQLPNRNLLEDRLEHALGKAKSNDACFALFLVDLDQFKKVNDSYGHDFGDEILKQFALRLKRILQPEDTLTRFGGDEFAILLESMKSENDATVFSQALLDAAKEPFKVKGSTFYLTSSVGVSLYPKDAQNKLNLLKCADAAVYRAKDEGRDNFQFYTNDLTLKAFEHLAMQTNLRHALINNELEVYFQPQVNAQENRLIGMEALVRWNHPQMGVIGPNRFIPIAEENGMIIELDRLTMRNAMQQWVKWYKQDFTPGILSLNLAVKNIQQPDFVEFVNETLQEMDCRPSWVELEVTESDIMKDLDLMQKRLNEIKSLGVKVSIDDFGTGLSSLAYLKRLPVSKLKIDQSFIRDLPDDEDDSVITKTVIAMAKSLGLEVIAEGVETPEQRDFLVFHGCNFIQGYLYSRPKAADEIEQWVRESF